jgi:hypothetical protein
MKSTSRDAERRLCTVLLVIALIGLNSCRWAAREERIAKEKAALRPLEKYTYAPFFDEDGCLESICFERDSAVTDGELATLKQFIHLRQLVLHSSNLTDAGLVHLQGLGNMAQLTVSKHGESSKLTDAGLSHLQGMRGLRRLSYGGARVTDAGLGYLSGLQELEELLVACPEATDKGLMSFAKLDHLKQLCLWNGDTMSGEGLTSLPAPAKLTMLSISHLTDAGMRTITRFLNLRELSTGGQGITSDGFRQLRALKNLEKLSIHDARLDNHALEQSVAQLTWLKELRISKCPISGDALKHLRALKALEVLRVSAPGIDDRSTPCLGELPKLWFVNLEETAITEASMADFLRIPELEELNVPFSMQVDREFRRKLSAALPKFCRLRTPDGEIQFAKTREERQDDRLRPRGFWGELLRTVSEK